MATYTHILQGSTTYVEDINTFMDTLSADMTRVENGVLVAANPIWRDIPVQNWTTGEVVSFSLLPYVISDSAVTIAYVSGTLPEGLTLVSGVITGTISALQGGSYEYVVSATNDSQVPIIKVLPAAVVSINVTAPIWGVVPDFVQEVGGAFSLDLLNDWLIYDGDPAKESKITFTYSATLGYPEGVDFTSAIALAGFITGITTAEAPLSTVTVTATNEAFLSADISFDITVNAIGAVSETPEVDGWYSGELECNAGGVVATWLEPAPFFVNVGQVVTIDMLTNFVASTDSTITAVNYAAGSDELDVAPDIGLVLDETGGGDGLGFITGTVLAGTSGTKNLSFTMDNTTGTSLDSGVFVMTINDQSTVTPTLVSIDGRIGSNEVFYNFSEPVLAVPALDFISGNFFTINEFSIRDLTYVSGTGTSRIKFTFSGLPASSNNLFRAVITNPLNNIQSVANGTLVADTGTQGVTYFIPEPVAAEVVFTDSFESGDLTGGYNGFRWTLPVSAAVSTTWPRTGNYSLKMTYPVENDNGYSWTEQRLLFPPGVYKEIWWQWYLYLPDGTEGIGPRYEHTLNSQGFSSNNKLGLLFTSDKHTVNTRNYCTLGLETYQTDLIDSRLRPYYSGLRTDGTKSNSNNHCLPVRAYVLPRGKWIKLRYHGKLATWTNGVANTDGAIDIWADGVLAMSGRNLGTIDCSFQGPVRYAPLYENLIWYQMCYFMGWANGGFEQETNVYIDDVYMATAESALP